MGGVLAAETLDGRPLSKASIMVPREKLRAGMQTSDFELVLSQFPCMLEPLCHNFLVCMMRYAFGASLMR